MTNVMKITNCIASDVPQLMSFIDQYWRNNHILSQERSVLDWYYGTEEGCNFLLAKRDGVIFAVLGYIDSDRFYPEPPQISELWLALWKVRDDAKSPGLGLRMILELKKRFSQRSISVLGLSETAGKIYSLLRYQVQTLDQLFIYNQHLESYQLMQGQPPAFVSSPFSGQIDEITNPSQLLTDASKVNDCRGRGASYFISRYIQNPFNDYRLFRIKNNESVSYAIGRVMNFKEAAALRVVDVYGQPVMVGEALTWFEQYLQNKNLEYLDLYYFGKDSNKLQEYGFINRKDCEHGVIIPNYFEPFVAQNVDLKCATETGFIGPIFKADGDQERPNQVS